MTRLVVGSAEYCYKQEFGNDMSQWEGFKKAWDLKESEMQVWKDKAMSRVNKLSEIEEIVTDHEEDSYDYSDEHKVEQVKEVLGV